MPVVNVHVRFWVLFQTSLYNLINLNDNNDKEELPAFPLPWRWILFDNYANDKRVVLLDI